MEIVTLAYFTTWATFPFSARHLCSVDVIGPCSFPATECSGIDDTMIWHTQQRTWFLDNTGVRGRLPTIALCELLCELIVNCLQIGSCAEIVVMCSVIPYTRKFKPKWSRSGLKFAAVKFMLHRGKLCQNPLSRSAHVIRFILTARSFSSFGRWCSVIPGLPWWLEYPGAKHPEQFSIEIGNYRIRPMLLFTAVGTKWCNQYGTCVEWCVLCRKQKKQKMCKVHFFASIS